MAAEELAAAAADEGAAGVAMRDDVQWRGKLTKVAKIGHDLRRNAILSCRVHLRYCRATA